MNEMQNNYIVGIIDTEIYFLLLTWPGLTLSAAPPLP